MDLGDTQTQGKQQTEIGKYVLSHTLGEGTTGKVKLGYDKETGEQVAVKIIPKAYFSQHPELQVKVHREIALMQLVDHPSIMKLVDILESARHMYIVMEYAEQGELFDYLISNRYLPEDIAMEFFRQIVLAVEYLHSLGICHRDLKPENILLDACTRIKIADFGFARWVSSNMTETSCGSPHYAAPEIIKGNPYDGKSADIWSLGVILYALLSGYLPFDDTSIRNLLNKVKRGIFQMPPFPAEIQDLIQKMLTVDPEKRITLEEIKAHPAFRMGLPASYIVPSPIPLPKFGAAIDPATLTSSTREILQQIGFENEEIDEQLQSNDHSMAKVFVMMLGDSLDLEQLPWEAAHAGPPKPLIDTSFIANSAVTPTAKTQEALTRGATEKTPITSLENFSLAARSDWVISATDVEDVLDENSFDTYGMTTWTIMSHIQNVLGDMPVQWFHQNPEEMYGRYQDGQLYFSAVTSFRTSEDVTLTLRLHKGNDTEFKELCGLIEKAIGTS